LGNTVTSRVLVFLDYQNVALAAHHRFGPVGTANRIANLDPATLGRLITSRRHVPSELAEVRVYRGLPNSRREPVAAAANSRQADAWERTNMVTTVRRLLRYPRGWPAVPAQEKGIDVSLAIDMIRLALEHRYDVGVLFSSDTDLVPALETLAELKLARFEVAAWAGTNRLRLAGKARPWCHYLSRADYLAVVDPTDYTKPSPTASDQAEDTAT
jgi:uncharacterized LabA/DUF88 family protein